MKAIFKQNPFKVFWSTCQWYGQQSEYLYRYCQARRILKIPKALERPINSPRTNGSHGCQDWSLKRPMVRGSQNLSIWQVPQNSDT